MKKASKTKYIIAAVVAVVLVIAVTVATVLLVKSKDSKKDSGKSSDKKKKVTSTTSADEIGIIISNDTTAESTSDGEGEEASSADTANSGKPESTTANSSSGSSGSGGSSSGGSSSGGSSSGGSSSGGSSSGGSSSGGSSSGGSSSGGSGGSITSLSKDQALSLLNSATASAAKGSYSWSRTCNYTKGIDVGNATDALNALVNAIDANANLNSVVGSFLGIGTKSGNVKNGKFVANSSGVKPEDKYLMMPTFITSGDVKQYMQSGNVHKFLLNDCSNPKKSGSAGNNGLNHATKDFITHEEINSAIKNYTSALTLPSSDLQYKNIIVTATIDNGKLTKLEISYTMDATLNLKITAVSIKGTCATKTSITYTNFS